MADSVGTLICLFWVRSSVCYGCFEWALSDWFCRTPVPIRFSFVVDLTTIWVLLLFFFLEMCTFCVAMPIESRSLDDAESAKLCVKCVVAAVAEEECLARNLASECISKRKKQNQK